MITSKVITTDTLMETTRTNLVKGTALIFLVIMTLPQATDTVQFMDVTSTELTGIYNSGGSLVITYGLSDQVTINGYFNQAATQIEQFKFSDGVTWSVADIKTKAVFKGTSGNDTFSWHCCQRYI